MPFSGTLDATVGLAQRPLLRDLKTEPWEFSHVEILHVLFETGDRRVEALLPPALHPTMPVIGYFTFMAVPESPVGPFKLAQVQITCRAGIFPRVLLLGSACDSDDAIRELSERWGYAPRRAAVATRRLHDRITGTVEVEGRRILDCALVDPQPLGGTSVYYAPSLHLARVRRDGQEAPRLIQVDPGYTIHRADRGRPEMLAFDAAAWSAAELDPFYPVSAFHSVADVTLPALRFIVDPTRPATEGTERLPPHSASGS